MRDTSKVLDSEQLKEIESALGDIAVHAHSINEMVINTETSDNTACVVAISDMARIIGITADALSHRLTGICVFGDADHWLNQKSVV